MARARVAFRVLMSLAWLVPLLAVAGCGGSGSAESSATAVKLQGAGASFPAPLYNKWFKAYGAAHPNVLVDYQSVGSGGGVKSVIDHDRRLRRQRRGDEAGRHGQGARRRAAVSDDGRQHRARLQPQASSS